MNVSFDTAAASLVETAAAWVRLPAPAGRLSLRARGDLALLEAALGLALPGRIGERAGAGTLEAVRLGPDEWTLLCAPGDVAGLQAACAAVSLPHSLVDISGREISYAIGGPRAVDLMCIGSPRDIDAIAVGSACRTVFDGLSVVLWRDGDTDFRLDVWNSFADHLLHLLEIGCRELAAEV